MQLVAMSAYRMRHLHEQVAASLLAKQDVPKGL